MSDDEEQINAKSHKQLLQAISSLGKSQHIRKITRDEPKLVQDEFQLVKGAAVVAHEKAHSVGVNDIVDILKGTKKHLDAGKQLKNVIATKKVLEKPMEKPAAERIKRTIGYENVKKKLAKWDAVVAKNRSAETQVFPLKSETIYVNTSVHRKQPLQQSIKSELMLQMEELENKYAELKRKQLGDTDDPKELAKREEELLKRKLTKDELMARRKELSYLKMRESQKSAKARMQNKIKSKKYHKLLKRQKMQEQIKEFELLQKTNPEAALDKLNALEKSRVLERANLRHKNTGTWAKNLQIRAKYDKDVRKDLAEQLQVSRQLTQKTKDNDSDDEERMESNDIKPHVNEQHDDYDPFNPWTTVGKKHQETTKEQEDKANWRQYWLERNNNEKMLEEYKKLLQQEVEQEQQEEKSENEKVDPVKTNDENKEMPSAQNKSNKKTKVLKKTKNKPAAAIDNNKTSSKSVTIENGWLVEEIDPATIKSQSIDDIFDAKEDRIKEKLSKKLDSLSRKGKQLAKSKGQVKRLKGDKRDPLKNLKDLSFKNELKRPVIDEELTNEENAGANHINKKQELIAKLMTSVETTEEQTAAKPENNLANDKIDPNQLACVKLKQHANAFNAVNDEIGDVDMDEEAMDDLQTEQQMTIAQAFEDDDIVADFTKDKTKDSEIKDAEIQLSMPGWGSWAGAGISKEQQERRNKRLLLKLAPKEKRKDENKGGLYINEEASKQLRNHLVSDIPFPYTSLSDYEASIRAPIGRNFVTETAFRLLTRPAVITQKGKVIEPMDESELVKPQRKLRNPVDIRISKMSAKVGKAK